MKIVLTKKVDKFLRKLHKSNPKMYNTLKKELLKIESNPYNSKYESVVKYPPYKCSRKNNYRICFKISDDKIIDYTFIRTFNNVAQVILNGCC